VKIEELIKDLLNSELFAECPCGQEFKIGDAFLFDGTKPFPEEALEKQEELKQQLEDRTNLLAKRLKQATEKAQITAAAVNIGKSLEKVLPVAKDFKWVVPDTKVLGDPIDLLVFNGLSNQKVESLSFVEVKSGAARLNAHQKSIRDAIEDHKVSYGVFK
jgi:predicted Holliday junction resolvase-like endonuclease